MFWGCSLARVGRPFRSRSREVACGVRPSPRSGAPHNMQGVPTGPPPVPKADARAGCGGRKEPAHRSGGQSGAWGVRPAGALERATLFGVRTRSGQPVRTRTTFGPGAVWSLRDHPQAPYGRPSLVGRRPGRTLANPNGGVLLREGHPNGVRVNLFGFASAWSALPQLGAP